MGRHVRVAILGAALACELVLAGAPVAATPSAAPAKKVSTAELRVVHVYAPPGAEPPAMTLVDSQVFDKKNQPKKLATFEYGDVSEFVKVPAGHSLQLVPEDDPDSGLFLQPLTKKARLTIIPFATSDDPEESGLQQLVIVERGKQQAGGDVADWPDVTSGKATVMMFNGALMPVFGSDFAGYLVTPGAGCLESADPSQQDTGTGGTIPAYYVVDPSSVEVALSETGCDATPIVGPESVTAAADDRVAIVPYGTSADDLQLLVLPVATP
jgi:hypothetical protein